MSKKAIARTTAILALIVVIFAAGLIYYATLPPAKVPVATITGKVTDAKTGGPVAGAAVTADGYGTTTGSDGAYSLSVKPGKYTVKVVTTGYEAKTASVDAAEEKTYTVNVPITPLPPPPPGPATITGKVTDAKTGAPITGATVNLDGLTYITGPDGTYSFSVKVGSYTITVSMTDKYEAKTASVSAKEEKKYTVDVTLTPIPPPRKYKMALMVGGDETDLGFSYMAIQGAYRIRDKYGWEIDISRLVSFADQARVASDYAARGYDLVFAVGGQFIPTIYFEVPKKYNDTYFAQVPGLEAPPPPPNVVALHPAFQIVGHYLGGVLAGKMTKTNAVAWVCGEWYPYIAMEFWAFKAGVERVNPNVKVYARVAGTWGDASLGFQIAKALIETKNVDIIVHVADLTGRGVIAACQAYGIKVMGSVADQVAIAPNVTLTSIMMDTPLFMEMVAQTIINGTFKEKMGGKAIDVNLGYLAPFHQFEKIVPQEVKDLLMKTEEDIKKGVIVVPRKVTDKPPPDPA